MKSVVAKAKQLVRKRKENQLALSNGSKQPAWEMDKSEFELREFIEIESKTLYADSKRHVGVTPDNNQSGGLRRALLDLAVKDFRRAASSKNLHHSALPQSSNKHLENFRRSIAGRIDRINLTPGTKPVSLFSKDSSRQHYEESKASNPNHIPAFMMPIQSSIPKNSYPTTPDLSKYRTAKSKSKPKNPSIDEKKIQQSSLPQEPNPLSKAFQQSLLCKSVPKPKSKLTKSAIHSEMKENNTFLLKADLTASNQKTLTKAQLISKLREVYEEEAKFVDCSNIGKRPGHFSSRSH